MSGVSVAREGGFTPRLSIAGVSQASKSVWSMGFIGVIAWLIIEYTRIAAMYPILAPLQLGKIAVGVAILGTLIRRVSGIRYSPEVRAAGLLIVCVLTATFFSMLFANFISQAWDGFFILAQWALVYWLISRVVTDAARLKVFLVIYLLLNLKLAQHAIRYYYTALGAYDEMVVVTRGAAAGSTGWFGNSADFGLGMCVVWAVAVCLLFSRPKGWFRLLLWACVILFLAAILVCGSRGAVVGAAAIVIVALVRNPNRLMGPIALLLLLPGIILVLPNASVERFRSAMTPEQDKTAEHRLVLWKAGIRIFEDHPILGVGPQNYAMTHHLWYSQGEKIRNVSVPHSLYIEMISEWGLAGSLPMIALWIWLFRINGRTRKYILERDPEAKRSFEYCLTHGLELGLVGYLTSGAFIAVLLYPHFWVLLGLSAGLNMAVRSQTRLVPADARKSPTLLQQQGVTC
jgi:O-antigen ligase